MFVKCKYFIRKRECAVFYLHLQIHLVGPVGPKLKKLMPSNISIPAASIVESDEFHLIMEFKVR
jgi:hypothetical protein